MRQFHFGLAGGIFVSIPMGEYLGIRPELLYSGKGYESTGYFIPGAKCRMKSFLLWLFAIFLFYSVVNSISSPFSLTYFTLFCKIGGKVSSGTINPSTITRLLNC